MNTHEVEWSRRLIDRAVKACKAHDPTADPVALHPEMASRFLLDCDRFLQATTANQSLAAATDRLLSRHNEMLAHFDRKEKEILSSVRGFVNGLARKRRLIDDASYHAVIMASDKFDDLAQLIRWGIVDVHTISERILDDVDEFYEPTPPQKRELRKHRERVALHIRRLSLFARQSPGFAYEWIKRLREAMNPEPGTVLAMLEASQSGEFGMVAAALFDRQWIVNEERAAFVGMWAKARRAVEAVHYELEFLLGQRENLSWALARYATRSRWYHLHRLQTLAEEASKTAEIDLTRDACSYMFDQGFDAVYPEVSSGSSRYDLVGHAGAERLLVESKIIRKGSTKKVIIDAANQIRNYASQRLAEGDALQSVLLIFRLGGRPVTVPHFVSHTRLPLFLCLVDLGKASDSGSKAPRGIDVTEADLAFEP